MFVSWCRTTEAYTHRFNIFSFPEYKAISNSQSIHPARTLHTGRKRYSSDTQVCFQKLSQLVFLTWVPKGLERSLSQLLPLLGKCFPPERVFFLPLSLLPGKILPPGRTNYSLSQNVIDLS